MDRKLREIQRAWLAGRANDTELFAAYKRAGLLCVETKVFVSSICAGRLNTSVGRL